MEPGFSISELGRRIKACRQAAGISQEKVAELIGVSRQAVTKWETGQSAPSTENLFKLAEIFGTSVDLILTQEQTEGRETEARKAKERQQRRRKNVRAALLIVAVYVAYYLIGRGLCVHYEDATVMGWLFANDWTKIDYLFGWLLSSNLFWYAMAVSVAGAALGKYRFSGVTAAAFGVGWLVGEIFGPYPEGIPLGHGHYGWAIWGCIFSAGIVAGAICQHRTAGTKAEY